MSMRSIERAHLRRVLDKRVDATGSIAASSVPGKGWLRSARDALGMSAGQVAARRGVSTANVLATEARESRGAVTLAALEETARAMGCRLTYAIVPANQASFEGMVDAQALHVARSLAKRTAQTMKLEDQAISPEETAAQTRELAMQLKEAWQPGYWDVE